MTSYANGRPQKFSRHFKSAMQRLVAFCCMIADSTTYVSKPTGLDCFAIHVKSSYQKLNTFIMST